VVHQSDCGEGFHLKVERVVSIVETMTSRLVFLHSQHIHPLSYQSVFGGFHSRLIADNHQSEIAVDDKIGHTFSVLVSELD
jgi:hypothetical protein